MSARGSRILYVCHTFPWVTQTFTVREVALLRSAGVDVEVAAFHRPTQLMDAQASGLLPITHSIPAFRSVAFAGGVARTALRRPIKLARLLLMGARSRCLLRTTPADRVRGVLDVLRGAYLAATFPATQHYHAEFADNACTAAMVAADLTDRSFSFKSHSSFNPQALARKVKHATFIALENEFDRAHYFPDVSPQKLFLNRSGVILAGEVERRDDESVPLRILCVATLQEKKGQLILIEALRLLSERNVAFRCTLVGSGPLEEAVKAALTSAQLGAMASLERYRPHAEILELYAAHDVFALPAVVASNGDRDGLPNVLIEAAAAGCALVSTPISGIPELVEDGHSGLLVPPGDADALAAALERLAGDKTLQARLRQGARAVLEERFDLERNVADLAERFGEITAARA